MITFSLSPVEVVTTIVIPVFLPLLVGLVTTKVTDAGVKATLLAALSLVSGLLNEAVAAVQSGTDYDLGAGLTAALPAFVSAVAMHYGLWKPTGLSEAAQGVGAGTGKHVQEGE